MLKPLLFWLAQHPAAREAVTSWPPARRLARRFVAGEHLEEGLAAVQALNEQGLLATLDHLGEHTTSAAGARRAAEEYLRLLDEIARRRVQATVSLKLTQMGLDVDEALCRENISHILERAQAHGNSVCIDMESSAYTQRTLDLFERLHERYPCVSTVIQAALRRSPEDVERLIARGAAVRVVKGAYLEPPEVAFPHKRQVDRQYVALCARLLSEQARARGVFTALATHDERLLRWACAFIQEQRIPPSAYEFQMLFGIRRDLQRKLAEAGHTVRVYVSYGTEWYPYFMRRLAERPANVLFLLKHLARP